MMGLIGQGCEHGDVLEVTGTNTPTQKTPRVCGQQKECCREQVFAAKKEKRMLLSCLCLLYSV